MSPSHKAPQQLIQKATCSRSNPNNQRLLKSKPYCTRQEEKEGRKNMAGTRRELHHQLEEATRALLLLFFIPDTCFQLFTPAPCHLFERIL